MEIFTQFYCMQDITTITVKLRWSLIEKIIPYKKDYIIVKQRGVYGTDKLYTLMNIKNGHFVSLHLTHTYYEKKSIKREYLKEDTLILECTYDDDEKGYVDKYDLKKLMKLLK